MKIKKPLLKIIQIWTLFLVTWISYLWVVSFSNPEINTFWTIRKLDITLIQETFAESGGSDSRSSSRSYNQESWWSNSSSSHSSNYNQESWNSSFSTTTSNNPSTTTTTNSTTNNSNSTATIWTTNTNSTTNPTTNCTIVTETVYDTVTSASWTQSQVPRQVSHEVCDTVNTPTTNTTNNNTTATTTSASTPAVTNNTPLPVISPVVVPVAKTVNKPVSQNYKYNDGTYTWNWKYSFSGGSVNYSVEITILSWKITSAKFLSFTPSGNWLYTQIQWENVLAKIVSSQNSSIDTVTWASWTSQAIQDAIDNALNQAKNTSTTTNWTDATNTNTANNINLNWLTQAEKNEFDLSKLDSLDLSSQVKELEWMISSINVKIKISERNKINAASEEIFSSIDSKLSTYEKLKDIFLIKKWLLEKEILSNTSPTEYKAPNGKIYTIMYKWGEVAIIKTDGASAKDTFQSFDEAINYLKINAVPAAIFHKAPNGKIYTIMYEWGKVVIKKADGSYARETFKSYEEAINYLKINAPKKIVIAVKKATVAKKVVPAVTKKATAPAVVKKATTPTTAVKPTTQAKPAVSAKPATTTTAS